MTFSVEFTSVFVYAHMYTYKYTHTHSIHRCCENHNMFSHNYKFAQVYITVLFSLPNKEY